MQWRDGLKRGLQTPIEQSNGVHDSMCVDAAHIHKQLLAEVADVCRLVNAAVA